MLMITVEHEAAAVTLRLEGHLAGPEARELAQYRSSKRFEGLPQRVSLDLTGVLSVDHDGREFLAQACRRGDRLLGGGAIKAIVDEIVASSSGDRGSRPLLDDVSRSLHPIFRP